MLKILVCDDEYISRMLTKQYLSYYDTEVIEAASAEDALEKIEEEKPDVIILDYSMPGMSGLEFLERLSHKIPVVMLTSEGFSRDVKEKILSRTDIYLTKPLLEQHLITAVEKATGVEMKAKHAS